jgi:membrane fusion protein, heavy metal efflux system
MATRQLSTFLRRLRRAAAGRDGAGLSDTQLLERFVRSRDEAAFEVLVWRHGPMVLAVCRRLLRREQDAEDAFQATFLALVRKAGAIGKREAVAAWLYKVAYRAALRVRGEAAKRPEGSRVEANLLPAPVAPEPGWDDLRPVLDEEVRSLPGAYRLTFILCHLEGKTQAEAAHQLGCPPGTVASRLAWARQRLRTRLARRGVVLSAAALAALLDRRAAPAAPPAALVPATVRAALHFAAGKPAAPGPAAVAEGVLHAMRLTRLKATAALLLIGCLLGAGTGLAARRALADEQAEGPELVPGTAPGLRLPPALPAKLGLQTGEVKPRTAPPRLLVLTGRLEIDPNRLLQVGSRFAGEVVEVGKSGPGEGARQFRPGDRVKKGQLLAVVWSKELGLKKAELLDALAQRQQDQDRLAWLEKMYAKGYVTEAAVREGRRNAAGDSNAAARAERTLRVWRLTDEEIQAVKALADGKRDPAREKDLARVEIRAPMDGTVLEKNVTVGAVVDTATVLFRIADLSTLSVQAQATDGVLKALLALRPGQRRWKVQVFSDPSAEAVEAPIDRISPVVNPETQTTLVVGHVANPAGRLRPGQAVRLTVTLPPPVSEVAVPASALVEEGGATYVFVQPDARERIYVPVRVEVVRRGRDTAHVRTGEGGGPPLSFLEALGGGVGMSDYDGDGWLDLDQADRSELSHYLRFTFRPKQAGAAPRGLRPGDRIVTAGAVELKALLHDLKPGPPR